MIKNRFRLFLLVLALLFVFLPPLPVIAQHFSSPSFIIDWGNFNVTSGKKSSTSYTITDTVGQNAPGQFAAADFILKSGFQYVYVGQSRFSFRISSLAIDFGTLVPNIGTSQTNIVTIQSPAGHGYQILAQENHPLWIDASRKVPDTRCDANNCSDTVSGVWNTNIGSTAYGFGFNVIGLDSNSLPTGIGTSAYFTNAAYFRAFADASSSHPAQTVMSETASTKLRSARVTYKTYISPQQTAGKYQTALLFTAVPKY